ncbi:hypothetical protein [Hoeflea poritis]|uniref:Uncharacterized protein n=1 Tax=Hoeflea poritis TaxID=2993659 RepID=A0ABT4VMN9_9HYPH|nr:hypothetical protein [Hoeflea poritis]MDA4845975.1 hypothetical protein [Hoeflea poritis]
MLASFLASRVVSILGVPGMVALLIIGFYEGLPGIKAIPFIDRIPLVGYLTTGRVDRQIALATEAMVAKAELVAARERERGLQIIIEEKNRREALTLTANAEFRERLAAANRANEDLNDEIKEYLARPVNGGCVVTDALWELMHNAE